MKYELSIIVPVYNVENYILTCLESIIKQKDDRCEIVIVNDGSTDRSMEICEAFLSDYPSNGIKIITQENMGASVARNTGIMNASGDYIMFLDSDDYLEHDAINVIYDAIKTNEDCMLIGSKGFHDGEHDLIENSFGYDTIPFGMNPAETLLKLDKNPQFWVATWLIVIKHDFLIKNDLYFKPGIYYEDELWIPQVFVKAGSVKLINHCIYCYRMNRMGSLTNKREINKSFDKFEIMNELNALGKISNKTSQELLQRRCAALEFGMILESRIYRKEKRYKELIVQIRRNLSYLKYKKYYVIYIMCRIIGIENVSFLCSWIK